MSRVPLRSKKLTEHSKPGHEILRPDRTGSALYYSNIKYYITRGLGSQWSIGRLCITICSSGVSVLFPCRYTILFVRIIFNNNLPIHFFGPSPIFSNLALKEMRKENFLMFGLGTIASKLINNLLYHLLDYYSNYCPKKHLLCVKFHNTDHQLIS